MPRAYTVATAALVLGVPIKWLDNVLSHFSLQGIVQERQGVARRITIEGMLQLYLVHSLSSELGTTIVVATQVAQKLAADGLVELSNGITIRADRDALRAELVDRLEHAVEVAPVPRRGRPPKNKTGRLD
jgi:hypothetical protein